MTKRDADGAADEFRAAVPPAARAAVTKTPEDFGLQFLGIDELIERAEREPAIDLSERRTARQWAAAGAGLATAAAVTAALVIPRLGEDANAPIAVPARPTMSPSPVPAVFTSARDVLLAAATVPGPATSGSPYWHVKSVQHFGADEVPREIWLGRNRPSVLLQDGIVDLLPPAAFPSAGETTGWSALQKLPTDPAALRRILVADDASSGRDHRWVIFKAAGDLVAEAPLPPQVRSAVFRVLAETPGAQHTQKTTDSTGRSGWTVSMTLPGEGLITYVIDPASGQLLESRHVPDDGRPAWSITFLERGPADSAPALTRA